MILVSRTIALALVGVAVTLNAGAAYGFLGGASEFTQLLNNAELVALTGQSGAQIDNQLVQIGHQVEQISNQLRIYQNMLQNTERLPAALWADVIGDLQDLQTAVQQGEALAFSMGDLDQTLRSRFASYAEQVAGPVAGTNFTQTYAQWSETTRDTIAGTLAAASVTSSQLDSEDSALAHLETLSGNALGQMQALQVGHQLAGQQIGQIQKLRALVSQQIVMTGTWYQSEQAARDLAQARREAFFAADPDDYPTTGGQDMEPRF